MKPVTLHVATEADAPANTETVAERTTEFVRFMAHVDVPREPWGCWQWRDSLSEGYGAFGKHGHPGRGHRWIFSFLHGPVPEGLVVRHRCDNRACVNPLHLELGTQSDNCQDMADRDRSTHGERHPQARLTAENVVEIRRLANIGTPYRLIGERFGILYGTVGQIVRRERWRRV